ncbi:hypothetical protein [Glutamicibacter protophormiae]|uniref:hypothetical protein n=1 Tax=Glutamicibacter protophormiae TaxID=37930 RepID=UPI0019588ADC|nr:hypothetical protein [Glutamicibacter protophormiae]QRQ79487.1 hypothetical protein JQN66_04480 [Glutamicibacter protophormiae]
MRLTADAAPAQQVRRLALGISHFLAPVTLATLLLLSAPLRREQVSWSEALVSACFTTIVPWLMLVAAKLRGKVTDMHVTRRHQRHRIYALTAGSIVSGLLLLWAMDAGGGIFREVLAILLGLFAVSMINLRWKVSVHLSGGTYAALQAANGMGGCMPLVLAGVEVLSWARIRSGQHTASQVCGGVLVGVVIHDAGNLLGTVLG